jgi:hypothetical protein
MAYTLTQTTLTAALTSGSSTIAVAAATGIVGPTNGFLQKLYVIPLNGQKGELMSVVAAPSGLQVPVSRLDEFKMTFPSGSIVLIASVDPTIVSFHGTNPTGVPGAGSEAAQTTPYVNVVTGEIWLVGIGGGQWVPGWNNPAAVNPGTSTALASAASQLTPTGPLFHVTGTLAITGWLLPVGFAGGAFTVIPDAIFTWTSANNIAVSGTAVVNRPLTFTYDTNTSKWYPSDVS